MIEDDVEILVNGKRADSVGILDRGFQYGDGLFETIAVRDGTACHWDRHWQRMSEGCKRLGIAVPDEMQLVSECSSLIAGVAQAVLKIIVTRGRGTRGYAPGPSPDVTRVLVRSAFPAFPPENTTRGISLFCCRTRLGINPALAGIKHLNRLEQVMASQEFDAGEYPEGIMLDVNDQVIEGTRSNLFIMAGNELRTPPLAGCGVQGIMRGIVIDLADQLDLPWREMELSLRDLEQAEEMFVTNSLIGLWPVRKFRKQHYQVGPGTRLLMDALPLCRNNEAA